MLVAYRYLIGYLTLIIVEGCTKNLRVFDFVTLCLFLLSASMHIVKHFICTSLYFGICVGMTMKTVMTTMRNARTLLNRDKLEVAADKLLRHLGQRAFKSSANTPSPAFKNALKVLTERAQETHDNRKDSLLSVIENIEGFEVCRFNKGVFHDNSDLGKVTCVIEGRSYLVSSISPFRSAEAAKSLDDRAKLLKDAKITKETVEKFNALNHEVENQFYSENDPLKAETENKLEQFRQRKDTAFKAALVAAEGLAKSATDGLEMAKIGEIEEGASEKLRVKLDPEILAIEEMPADENSHQNIEEAKSKLTEMEEAESEWVEALKPKDENVEKFLEVLRSLISRKN